MKNICVFTPTYNRAYRLPALYDSLLMQQTNNVSFYWLIVDDGSTDSTEELVHGFQESCPFLIAYHKQKNGGKQRAHNAGVAIADCELFLCVDSDDILPPNALQTIWDKWLSVRDNPRVAGVIGLCGKDERTPLVNEMPQGIAFSTMWDLYYKYGYRGDTTIAHKLDILREFPFHVEEGEMFIAETYVYHQIDQEYTLAVIDKVLKVIEYLPDGYTTHVRKITRDNPLGYIKLKRMYIEYSDTFPLKLYNSILYLVGCILAKRGLRVGIKNAPSKSLAILASPIAWILSKTEFRR